MSTTLDRPISNIEIGLFMQELNMADETRCESRHLSEGNKVCTGKVTHRLLCACFGTSQNVCDGQARYTRYHLNRPGSICRECKNFVVDCWRIFPI